VCRIYSGHLEASVVPTVVVRLCSVFILNFKANLIDWNIWQRGGIGTVLIGCLLSKYLVTFVYLHVGPHTHLLDYKTITLKTLAGGDKNKITTSNHDFTPFYQMTEETV
jgi:hypothetical protein